MWILDGKNQHNFFSLDSIYDLFSTRMSANNDSRALWSGMGREDIYLGMQCVYIPALLYAWPFYMIQICHAL